MSVTKEISGKVYEWAINGKSRKYMQLTMPYEEFAQFFKPDLYNHKDGKGEQRAIVNSHRNKLEKAIIEGVYTPTTLSASLRERHRKNLLIENDACTLTVSSEDPLPLTDGGHRCAAIADIIKDNEELAEQAKQLPISFLLLLDGAPQCDFINLQAGRTIDASHMFSLKLKAKMLDKETAALYKTAQDIAEKLNKNIGSPFKSHIAFDSRSQSTLKITTVCAKGSSDLSTSLIGVAKVMEAFKSSNKDLPAEIITSIKNYVDEKAPELFEAGKALTPLPEGTKGAATMLIGVGLVVLFKMSSDGKEAIENKDLAKMLSAAKASLDVDVSGGFPAQMKRKLMGEFAAEFLSDNKDEKHEGVPVTLLNIISPSAFGLSQLPK